ncbi:MAG: hypothetical protein K6D94_09145, partial [Clostridiales bacterium]|nr:hypothetical protein [Clostridiales bacterium]
MKKNLMAVVGVIIIAAMVTAPLASYADFGRSYTAFKGTPTIDGTVEALWDSAEWTQVDKPYDGSDAADYPGAALRVKVLWDDKNCYFLAEVTDSDVNYDNDIVEIYFDENNAKEGAYEDDDSQTRFYKDGVVVAGSGTNCKEDSVAKGVDTATGWIIEGALPWSISHKEGETVGFELMYNIGDSDADFAQAFRWNADTGSGDPAPYADNTAFGALILAGAAPVAEAAPAGDRGAASLGNVPQSYADIAVDAQKDDIYAEALVLDISRPLTDGQDETGCHGTGWLLYKDGWLYEYAEITDPQLFDPDPDKQQNTPWETDSLELFVNVKNSEDSTDVMQYRIDCQGWPCVYDQNGIADYGPEAVGDQFKYAERAINGGYAVEFAVPLNVAEGAHVSFQNQINDRYDDDQSQVQWMTPSSLNSSSWTADLYDYIVIGAMLTPPAVEAAPAPAAEA